MSYNTLLLLELFKNKIRPVSKNHPVHWRYLVHFKSLDWGLQQRTSCVVVWIMTLTGNINRQCFIIKNRHYYFSHSSYLFIKHLHKIQRAMTFLIKRKPVSVLLKSKNKTTHTTFWRLRLCWSSDYIETCISNHQSRGQKVWSKSHSRHPTITSKSDIYKQRNRTNREITYASSINVPRPTILLLR